MIRALRLHCFSALVLGLLAGCGGTSQTAVPAKFDATGNGPHGATAYRLPADAGTVEIRLEMSGQGVEPVLAAYFLQGDTKTPLATAPTGVSASFNGQDGSPVSLDLKPEPKTGDPVGSARFASAPSAALMNDEIFGQLKGTASGQAFEVAFGLR